MLQCVRLITNNMHFSYYAHNVSLQYKKLITRWDSERELFYDDIMHALQNTKRAEVYTNFIMVKSDLHLNLKIMMS